MSTNVYHQEQSTFSEQYRNSFFCNGFHETCNRKPFRVMSQCAKSLKEFSQEEGPIGILKNIGSRFAVVPFLVTAAVAGVFISASYVTGLFIRPLVTLVVTLITFDRELLSTFAGQLAELGLFVVAVTVLFAIALLLGLMGSAGSTMGGSLCQPVIENGGVITATFIIAPFAIPLLTLLTLCAPGCGYGFIESITSSVAKK